MITRKVSLSPEFIGENMIQHLYSKIHEEFTNTCDRDIGYILSVKRIVNIHGNIISRITSNIIFSVEFEVETIKPEKGDIIEGKVCMLYKDGIFVDNIYKILVPSSLIKDYKFTEDCYTNDKGEKIKEGDMIKVKLIAVKYDNKKFSCIGDLKT